MPRFGNAPGQKDAPADRAPRDVGTRDRLEQRFGISAHAASRGMYPTQPLMTSGEPLDSGGLKP